MAIKNARDVERMTTQELKNYLAELNATANERVAKLKEAGVQLESAAYRNDLLNRGIRKFKIPKNATDEALKTHIYAAQDFIRSPTSKVENVAKEFEQFKAQFGKGVTKTTYRRYVKNYYKINDTLEASGVYLDSLQRLAVIEISYKTKGSISNVMDKVLKFLSDTEEYADISTEWFEY